MITPEQYLYQLVECTKDQLIEQFKKASIDELNNFVASIDQICNEMIKLHPNSESTKTLLAKYKPLRKLAEKYVKLKFKEAF